MKKIYKLMSVLLAVLMVASAVSVGVILSYHLPAKEESKLGSEVIILSEEEQTASSEPEDAQGDYADKNPVPDEELHASEENSTVVSAGNMNASAETEPEEDKSEYFDDDNAIKIPFDQIYPEEFEEGAFDYDEETLMIKVSSLNDERKSALSEAGILKLEEMMILEDAVWYVAYIAEGGDITEVMAKVRELSFIKVAEYNFEYQTAASIIDCEKVDDDIADNEKAHEQWHLRSCRIHNSWNYPKEKELPVAGEGVIVAVIDTGVDYDHIDLKANMWKNVNEIPDNGIDDDGNGYIDDYYGVDIVAGKGNGDDDHGHGTHVAGIIAASNNKEGVVGIAYESRIMAIKAGNASGYFLQSDIAKAILYAYENGAEVINMSFGGSASSVAVQDALAVAYSRCVLVAAAGNDGLPNEYVPGWIVMPSYPAALGYVLGVMSVDEYGRETSFTNWDVKAFNGVEYELYAPGQGIVSTIPNNQYAKWSGTSMAAPVVSAIAANLRAVYTDRTTYPTKFIYGQLASTSEIEATCLNPEKHGGHNLPMIVDAYAAMTELPKPELDVTDFAIFDREDLSTGNNGDGVIDAGETFELGFTLRNRWGMSKNTVVTVDSVSIGGVANKYVSFDGKTSSSVDYGSVGTYSEKNAGKIIENDMQTGWENPFVLTVSSDCPNDYILTINYTIRYENGLDESDKTVYETNGSIEVAVRRGTLVPDDISEDMTLTADKLWIVPYSVLVREGVTLTVEAGTNIQFYCSDANDPYAQTSVPYIEVAGTLLFKGTEDNHIKIYPSEIYDVYAVQITESGNGYTSMEFCDVVNPYFRLSSSLNREHYISYAYGCEFTSNYDGYMYLRYWSSDKGIGRNSVTNAIYIKNAEKCSFRKMGFRDLNYGSKGIEVKGTFYNCIFHETPIEASRSEFVNCVFQGCEGYLTLHNYSFASRGIVDGKLYSYIESYGINPKTETDAALGFIDYAGLYLAYQNALWNINYDTAKYDSGTFIGLYKDAETGEYTWVNGPVADDTVKAYIVPGEMKYGCAHNGKIWFIEGEQRYELGHYYYRVDDIDGVFPDKTSSVMKKMAEYISGMEEWNFYKGNAIINNMNRTKDFNKLIIKAFEDDSHLYTINVSNNYWGTTNLELIEKQITDFGDNKSLAQINPGNFLTEAPENVWPFVVKAGTIVDGIENIVMGAGEVKFFVEFNRDMDTTIPLSVTYGSYEPYADYTVEGEYVSPRRWEGTATVSTLIEGGTQYFSISNGKAADSFQKLYTDAGRFTFEIDMTEALAMNLQATAEDTHIHLEWFQDDFDTLMGYNVYRATEEDGFYTKLNDVIIPADVTEFDDYEIEPGVVYYYNFTVVKTDLTESVPSGKQSLMSKDTMAPDMYHTPVYNAFSGNNLVISATVTDNVAVDTVKLYYRITGAESWKTIVMNKSNDKYSAIIPAAEVTTAGVEYYIEAFDGISYTYKASAEEPYYVTVQLAVSDNDKGDVDGDGVITNKDALMLLQAINDLLNLDAEQFARADINGDGLLNAVEALRILQYVSGKITSVLFD